MLLTSKWPRSCNSWTVPKVSWWGVAMHHTGPRWNVRCSIVTSDHVQLWTMRCLHIQPTVIWCLHTQPSLDWYDVIPSPQWYHVITSECQPAPTLYFTVYILGWAGWRNRMGLGWQWQVSNGQKMLETSQQLNLVKLSGDIQHPTPHNDSLIFSYL